MSNIADYLQQAPSKSGKPLDFKNFGSHVTVKTHRKLKREYNVLGSRNATYAFANF